MNVFDEYKKTYITVCFSVAVIYAFALGEGLSVPSRVANGLMYGAILCFAGIVLWNIFRFAIPTNYNSKYRLIFIAVLAVLTGLLITAVESFAVYLSFPYEFDAFAHSIPARLFIALLLFVIIRLFYVFCSERHRSSIDAQENRNPSEVVDSESANAMVDRITVRNGQKINIIPIDEIIFIKADGDYISINTANGSWLKEQTMKYTEEVLPPDRFVRIHRSYIVNINCISRIERYGEKQQVVLHNNEKIKVSIARYQVLRQVLEL